MSLFNKVLKCIAVWQVHKISTLIEYAKEADVCLDPEAVVIKSRWGRSLRVTGTSKPLAKVEKQIVISPGITCKIGDTFPIDKIIILELRENAYNSQGMLVTTHRLIYRAQILR